MLERRLLAFERHLPHVAAGDVDAVHQARVASRRLREAVPVVAVDAKGVGSRRLVRRIRRATRALGPVRELDVALTMTADLAARWQTTRTALSELAARLHEKRATAHARALQKLDDARLRTLGKRARSLLAAVRDTSTESGWRAKLSRRLDRRGRGLRQAIEAAGALYAVEALHAVRIATKKLRYTIELVHETRSASVAGPLARLKRTQDLLGQMHDLDVLTGYLRELAISAGESVNGEPALQQLVSELTRESRLLHARYLRRREALIELADWSARRLSPALAVGRARPLRAAQAPRSRAASGGG
jgi:CHAD domain-containing protein